MSSLSRLIAAATLISSTALAPGLAAADDRHEGREERREQERGYDRDDRYAPPQALAHVHGRGCGHDERLPAPPASWSGRDDLRWDGRAWVRAGWDRREQALRATRAQAIRLELGALDRDRAMFHARFARRPGQLARYDARWFEQRAGLEQELQRLTWYAWR